MRVENVMLTLNSLPGTLLDRVGQGTGFTSVQPNTAGDQYDQQRINLEPTAGTLVLTATQGTNTTFNTLKNALQVPITTEPFTSSVRSKVRLPILLILSAGWFSV